MDTQNHHLDNDSSRPTSLSRRRLTVPPNSNTIFKLRHHLHDSLSGNKRGYYHAFAVNSTVARHEVGATCDDCGERGHTAAACETRVRNTNLMNTSRCGSCGDVHARVTACDPARRNRFIRTCVSDGGASLVPRKTFSRP